MSENKSLLTIQDLEKLYRLYVTERKSLDVNLAKWLPKMAKISNGFAPGEMVVVLAVTGIGKSALIQNIIWKQKLPAIFFSAEMAEVLTFQRHLQIAEGKTEKELFEDYEDGRENLNNIFEGMKQCRFVHGAIDIDEIVPIVQKYEIDTDTKIRIIAIDHLDFVRGKGSNSYERTSQAINELHNIAQKTQSVVFVISQIHRPDNIAPEKFKPNLMSAKGSGNIEQAADNVFSLYVPGELGENDHPLTNLKMEVLKLRRGIPNKIINLHYDAPTMRIEQADQWINS